MYTNLPIFKQALDLNVYIEETVRNFSRFHKYGIGTELREKTREVLYAIYRVYYRIKKENCKYLLPHKTLFNMPKNQELSIGNLKSQFFANIYMNDFDNFIKRRLKVKYYMRYVDDMILLGRSKDELNGLRIEITNILEII